MNKLRFLSRLLGLIPLLIVSNLARAEWGHQGGHAHFRYHDHPHYGVHVRAFYPGEYYPVWVGGNRYYYDDGLYYNYMDGNYVVATPPIGAVVSSVPSDFQPTVINGMTYYVDNGTYYIHTPDGYKVVSAPTQNAFTVKVPNHSGGYTAVIIKKSGNGYIGPQGEFYQQFPNIAQLRTMYGR